MITDITGDIVNDGRNTITKLVNSYAPPSENNTAAYISAVSNYTGIPANATLAATRPTIEKLIRAKMNVELSPTHAARISQADINEAFNILSPQVKQWLNMPTGGDSINSLGLVAILAGAAYLVTRPRRRR